MRLSIVDNRGLTREDRATIDSLRKKQTQLAQLSDSARDCLLFNAEIQRIEALGVARLLPKADGSWRTDVIPEGAGALAANG